MAHLCLIFGLLFSSLTAYAYPQFIGYKYSSCVTCHYNTHGNGPLNDYGRALWSSEIAGRLWSGKKNAEELGASSGFIGSKQLPWWIRPGIKARQLWVQTNPGGASSANRDITMQLDANLAVFFDRDQKYAFVGSIGYVPEPLRLEGTTQEIDTWISREHYFRWQYTDELWLSVGMMDKVYGIRHVNHTAYSRRNVGLAQNDQSHGVIAHYIKSNWELTGNLFIGNLNQQSDLQQRGLSSMVEYDLADSFRVGSSILYSSNEFIKNFRFGVHSKYGLGHGSALLFEMGLIQDSPERGDSTKGYYLYSEAMQKIVRGYHAFVAGQAFKRDFSTSTADTIKFGTGLLAFPMARLEARIEVENTRQLVNSGPVPKDTWALLAQLHVAL